MGDTFHFVDALRTDRASKRLARRHVMKGKNAGKTIHRRTQRMGLQRQRPEVTAPSLEQEPRRFDLISPAVTPKYLGSQMLVLTAPVDFTAYSLRVINQFFTYVSDRIYPIQLGLTLEDAKHLWLQLLVADEATHHCSVALFQACNQIFLLDGGKSPEEFYHLSQAYMHIKRRLKSADALSDSTIWLVVAFAHQEQIRRDCSQARVHIEGMRTMVQLRGGIGELEGNLPLTLKLCKTDVIFTLQYGGPTAFFRDKMPQVRDSLFVGGPHLDQIPHAPPVLHEGLDTRLHEVLVDVLHVSSVFNRHSLRRRASLIVYQEMVLSILYRLLNFQPLDGSRPGPDIEAAYRIGLTIFMTTIFLQHQHHRFIDLSLTLQSLKDIVETRIKESELAFWAMVIGGIWMWDDPGGEWLAPKLRAASQDLGIKNWGEAHRVLKRFPWIDRIHDESGRQVWEEARE